VVKKFKKDAANITGQMCRETFDELKLILFFGLPLQMWKNGLQEGICSFCEMTFISAKVQKRS
jgi:hypothetical protein